MRPTTRSATYVTDILCRSIITCQPSMFSHPAETIVNRRLAAVTGGPRGTTFASSHGFRTGGRIGCRRRRSTQACGSPGPRARDNGGEPGEVDGRPSWPVTRWRNGRSRWASGLAEREGAHSFTSPHRACESPGVAQVARAALGRPGPSGYRLSQGGHPATPWKEGSN